MMSAKLAALLGDVETVSECATCDWPHTLDADEQKAFGRHIQLSNVDQRRYGRARLHRECVKMGYPLKLSAFKSCVRLHHVDQ